MKNVVRYLIITTACSAFVSSVRAVEPGFIPLLDRDHADGWVQRGPGRMEIRDGISTNSTTQKWGIAVYSKRMFADFVLLLEFKPVKHEFNSGVWLRFSELDDFTKIHTQKYEVGIRHSSGDMAKSTGAIWATRPALEDAVKAREWNEMEISVVGQRYMVRVNGRLVNDFIGSKGTAGYIGLEENIEGPVQFRNVRIKDLNDPLTSSSGTGSLLSTAPAPQVTTYKPDQPQIKIHSEESVNVTSWITSPLDVAVPEQIWENLNFLKEALKDEAAQKPVATPASYQFGVRLCLKMLENLEARDTATARAGGAAVLHQKSNLTQQNRNHLTWPQFALERDERAERKDNDRKADKFMNGHYAVEWNTNTTVMRREMQALYSQFREALRQQPMAN